VVASERSPSAGTIEVSHSWLDGRLKVLHGDLKTVSGSLPVIVQWAVT